MSGLSTHLAIPEDLDSDQEDTGYRGWLGLRHQQETGGPLRGQREATGGQQAVERPREKVGVVCRGLRGLEAQVARASFPGPDAM